MASAPDASLELTEHELRMLEEAFREAFPDGTTVLGARLGTIVHQHLGDLDIKKCFGGLKSFLSQHFPTQFRWERRQGLDDVFQVSWDEQDQQDGSAPDWHAVKHMPTEWLWPAVSNPSIDIQLAWSAQQDALLYADPAVPLTQGLSPLQKFSEQDYRELAAAFARSRGTSEASEYEEALEDSRSFGQFVAYLRSKGVLRDWEVFRIQQVLELFSQRLRAAGATSNAAAELSELLSTSQRQARGHRLQNRKTSDGEQVLQRVGDIGTGTIGSLNLRSVTAKAMEFLSEAELNELRLPVGAVVRAIEHLLKAK